MPTQTLSSSSSPSPTQQNSASRSLIQQLAIERTQSIYSATINPSTTPVLNITPQNVGLIKGFWVSFTATVTNPAGSAITPADFCAANLFSNITFTDLQNNQRINTTGWHLHLINSIKQRKPFFSADLGNSMDLSNGIVNYGNNFPVWSATQSIAASGTGTVTGWYWVPLAYSDHDYRGAVYANVVSATMNLQVTFNSSVSVASGDSTSSMYVGNAGATLTNCVLQVYQVYMDQIPTDQKTGLPILPLQDLSTLYQLQYTAYSSIVQNLDFPMQYANYRYFISSIAIFNNGASTGHGGRNGGSDVNTWALQSANLTNVFKRDPFLQSALSRGVINTDLPLGTYYFSYRQKPISTNQYGNMQLVLNAKVIAGVQTPYILHGVEMFSYITTISQAGSLSAS